MTEIITPQSQVHETIIQWVIRIADRTQYSPWKKNSTDPM
jgi:hypothetical protein